MSWTKKSLVIVCLAFSLISLFPFFPSANAQETVVGYKISLKTDGSALWTMTQVQDISSIVDTWEGFQKKIVDLVDLAQNQTNREMAVDLNSLQMQITISQETQSKTIEYDFNWLNFSKNDKGLTSFGDVFTVKDFFQRLYGDGSFEAVYTPFYILNSVTSEPTGIDEIAGSIKWLRTQDLLSVEPSIILTLESPSPTSNNKANALNSIQSTLILAAVTTLLLSLTIFFLLNRQKNNRRRVPIIHHRNSFVAETEEEKILKVVRSNGGSIFQSEITDQCRFSKAKTSQLLTALEKRNVVHRYKKGRDKIVVLAEKSRGQKI
jgi:hypothetical protein